MALTMYATDSKSGEVLSIRKRATTTAETLFHNDQSSRVQKHDVSLGPRA